jgi:uncharacterized membrane protein YccC
VSTAGSLADALSKTVEDALDAAGEVAEAARAYLATEQGREIRHKVATAVIVGLPLISELPGIRRSPIGRLVRTAALGALVIKGAEWLRDWEPGRPTPI